MDNRCIALFDSGLGGLSIWSELKRLLPRENTIYLADHLHLPYGEKEVSEIRQRTADCLQWLSGRNVKLIIVACNSSTVAGISYYRRLLPNFPIVGVVPMVKPACLQTKTGKIAVLSTPLTTQSDYQKRLIRLFSSGVEVHSIACPGLVSLVEAGRTQGAEVRQILRNYLSPLLELRVDVVVLGCTHYPFLKDTMQKVTGAKIKFLDSGIAVAQQAQRLLASKQAYSTKHSSEDRFFTTGDPVYVSRAATKLLGREARFYPVKI